MNSIQERRQQILSEKLREMGNIGVKTRTPEESPFFDPLVDLEPEEENRQKPEMILEEAVTKQPQAITELEITPTPQPKDPRSKTKKEELAAPVGLSFEQYSARLLIVEQLYDRIYSDVSTFSISDFRFIHHSRTSLVMYSHKLERESNCTNLL